jgi:hypothetical protein
VHEQQQHGPPCSPLTEHGACQDEGRCGSDGRHQTGEKEGEFDIPGGGEQQPSQSHIQRIAWWLRTVFGRTETLQRKCEVGRIEGHQDRWIERPAGRCEQDNGQQQN